MPGPFHSRRWLQFSVRTLLGGMTVLAAVLAYHVKWMNDRREVLARERNNSINANEKPTAAPGLLRLVGEPGVEWIVLVGPTDSEAERVRKLFPESEVFNLFSADIDIPVRQIVYPPPRFFPGAPPKAQPVYRATKLIGCESRNRAS